MLKAYTVLYQGYSSEEKDVRQCKARNGSFMTQNFARPLEISSPPQRLLLPHARFARSRHSHPRTHGVARPFSSRADPVVSNVQLSMLPSSPRPAPHQSSRMLQPRPRPRETHPSNPSPVMTALIGLRFVALSPFSPDSFLSCHILLVCPRSIYANFPLHSLLPLHISQLKAPFPSALTSL